MKKYFTFLKLNIINRIDYKQEFLMSLITGLLVFFGHFVFWNAAYQGDNEVVIRGYTLSSIIAYYIILRLVSEIVESRSSFRLSEMVTSGNISNLLIKPINVKLWFLNEELSRVIMDILIKLIIYVGLLILLTGAVFYNPVNIILFCLSICLSFIISFNIYFLVGCIAFITESSSGINYAVRRIIFFLSGGLIPLSFFPDALNHVLSILPFEYIFNFPITLLVGDSMAESTIISKFAVQLLWAVFTSFIVSRIFRLLVLRNQSVGI